MSMAHYEDMTVHASGSRLLRRRMTTPLSTTSEAVVPQLGGLLRADLRPVIVNFGGWLYTNTAGGVVLLDLYVDGVFTHRTGHSFAADPGGVNAPRHKMALEVPLPPSGDVRALIVKLNAFGGGETVFLAASATTPAILDAITC